MAYQPLCQSHLYRRTGMVLSIPLIGDKKLHSFQVVFAKIERNSANSNSLPMIFPTRHVGYYATWALPLIAEAIHWAFYIGKYLTNKRVEFT